MDYTPYVGRCLCVFLVAILLDAVGLTLFLIGVFAPVNFWDFLVFTGPLIIFSSLGLWILWYLGNIEVPPEELLPRRPAVEVVVTFERSDMEPATVEVFGIDAHGDVCNIYTSTNMEDKSI